MVTQFLFTRFLVVAFALAAATASQFVVAQGALAQGDQATDGKASTTSKTDKSDKPDKPDSADKSNKSGKADRAETAHEGTAPSQPSAPLEKAIVDAKILDTGVIVGVDFDPSGEVIVTTLKPEQASARDLKIDSVLIGRAVMKANKSVHRVKINYFHGTDFFDKTFEQVVIREGDVNAFATKSMNEADLLASLEIQSLGYLGNGVRLAPKTGVGREIGALGCIIDVAGGVRALELKGVDVSIQKQAVLDAMDLIMRKRIPDAQRLLNQTDYRLTTLRLLNAKAGIVHVDTRNDGLRPARNQARNQLTNILQTLAPLKGTSPGMRCRLIARINELKDKGEDVNDVLKAYMDLQDQAGQNTVRQTNQAIREMADSLLTRPASN